MPASSDPELALRLAKETVGVYSEAVEQLLGVVARRLARGIDDEGWPERKLIEMARLRDEATALVDRLGGQAPDAVRSALLDAYAAGERAALAEPGITAVFGRTDTLAVDALVRETVTTLQGTHLQILRATLDVYRGTLAEVASGAVTGSRTRRQVAQQALDRFADRGIAGFVDNAGRRWELGSDAEMATRTAVGRAQVAGTLDRFVVNDRDLVIVSDAPQECRACRPWEGRVLSVSGATPGYPTVGDARDAGLLHANCRHALGLYVPGLTQRMTHTADPEGDRLRQEQRRLERGVRQWKRREQVALDDVAAARARAHTRQWQARLREHVDGNDLKRLRYREQIGRAR